MRKIYLLIILAIITVIICGCSTKRKASWVMVFEAKHAAAAWPQYITLKKGTYGSELKPCELYDARTQTTIVGSWMIKKDTIIFDPYFEYNNNGKLQVERYSDDTITTLNNIQRKYLIKNDRIIDITEYGNALKSSSSIPIPTAPIPYYSVKLDIIR